MLLTNQKNINYEKFTLKISGNHSSYFYWYKDKGIFNVF